MNKAKLSYYYFISILFFAFVNPSSAQIHINEFSASNLHSFEDRLGKTEDWIELYNSSDNDMDISGWHLSDKASKPMKWAIPQGAIIPAKGFFIVYCSGRDRMLYDEYHANFKLSQTTGKDIVLLSDPMGNVIESFPLDITLVEHSRCRSVDGGSEWVVCAFPTFGSSNDFSPQYSSYTVAPGMDLEAGFYDSPQTVSLINYEPNGEIRYTTDGTNPTINSPLYTGPITISQTTVIKARSYSSNANILPGKMDFRTFFINEDFSLAVFSVASDEVINLANGDGSLIPIGSIEYFNKNKERESISFGSLNRHGKDSWALDHRSLDWVSRDEMGYTKAINAELFSTSNRDEYQKFMFRNSGDDNYPASGGGVHTGATHIRDEYVHSLAQLGDMELDVRSVERVVLFLNGQYWGVYGLRDRPVDHDYTDFHYDQGKYDIQYLSTWGNTTIQYGGGKAHNDWVNLRNFILTNDMSIPENYTIADDSLNMVSLIDYMLTNLNVVASDWLNYNTAWWRGMNQDGQHKKWGYILWDLDATFDYYINYSSVPNTSPNAQPCDLEFIAENIWFFSFNPVPDLIPGEIENPNLCNSILNGSSPYPASDPFFALTVENYTPCCENWDGVCSSIYYNLVVNEGVLPISSELNGSSNVGQHEKIFLKLLDESPEFKRLYYGRYADLMSTVFTCDNMITVLDSMVNVIRPEMPRQISRWGGSVSEWEDNIESLKEFIYERCELIDDGALDCYDELTGPYDVTLMVSPNIGIGEIDFNELDIEVFPWSGQYFGGTENEIKARVFDEFAESYVFSHWISSANNVISPTPLDRRAYISLTQNDTLTAVFVPVVVSDLDGDGFTSDVDCDDSDPNIYPGAQEICDNIDNNCDGQIDEGLAQLYYQDLDGDGFGNPLNSISSCTGQVGYTLNNTDCDDNNPAINPGAVEICDNADNNCNGQIDENISNTYYADNDNDGYGDPNNSVVDCIQPAGFTLNNTDCDDSNGNINEGAIEVPNNGIDENCDGMDEVTGTDVDGDGYFSDVDCNDNDASINPGTSEICDGLDNNCDGQIDEGFVTTTYYLDQDGDGFGDPNNFIESCVTIAGYSLNNTDCDDSNGDINEEAEEIPDNGIDENCDGVDEIIVPDPCENAEVICELYNSDGISGQIPNYEGMVLGLLCEAFVLNNPIYYEFVAPASEFNFSITPSNCAEGVGIQAAIIDPCNAETCYTDTGGVCILEKTSYSATGLNTGQTYQIVVDGCAGDECEFLIEIETELDVSSNTYYIDLDGDGYGDPNQSMVSCFPPLGYSLDDTDCNDNDNNINPGAIEIEGNAIDDNCDGNDGVVGEDLDMDGYFGNDCDDSNPDINPGAIEICDGIDNNCDGEIDEGFVIETYYTDADMDGYGVGAGFTDCVQPPDTSTQGGDCDDQNPDINPEADEIPNNTIDENCDGDIVIIDNDGDGWNSDLDCDDTNAAINPGATELGGNGIDEDCDGVDGPSALISLAGFYVEIFPNPVSNELNIQSDLSELSYELYSTNGRKLIYGSVGTNIDLTSLPSGVYYLFVQHSESTEFIVHKLIKI